MTIDETLEARVKELIQNHIPRQRYFRPKEAAEYLRISARHLEHWRATGQGPRFSKPDKAVLYDRKDLDEWVASHHTVGGA